MSLCSFKIKAPRGDLCERDMRDADLEKVMSIFTHLSRYPICYCYTSYIKQHDLHSKTLETKYSFYIFFPFYFNAQVQFYFLLMIVKHRMLKEIKRS